MNAPTNISAQSATAREAAKDETRAVCNKELATKQATFARALSKAALEYANVLERECGKNDFPIANAQYGVMVMIEQLFDDGDVPTAMQDYKDENAGIVARGYGYTRSEIDEDCPDWGDIWATEEETALKRFMPAGYTRTKRQNPLTEATHLAIQRTDEVLAKLFGGAK